MIFAELQYTEPYGAVHEGLLAHLSGVFPELEAGLQGDSWIWVFECGEKVAVDTFTAMQHQVKADRDGPLVRRVIEALSRRYPVRVYPQPLAEGHDNV